MIRLTHIHKSFQVGDEQVHGLNDVSADIEAGEYIAIMGPSGSGKSTLLNVLGLLDQPDSGEYWLDGEQVTQLSEQARARTRREKIGFVFQTFNLVQRLTAFDNVALPLTLAGVDRDERAARVHAVMESIGLANRLQHRPDQLSGGQRQRVAIARAVISKPILLLADEPTGNLDHASGLEVIGILEALHQQGITLLLVTHDPELGKRTQKMIRMIDGKVLE